MSSGSGISVTPGARSGSRVRQGAVARRLKVSTARLLPGASPLHTVQPSLSNQGGGSGWELNGSLPKEPVTYCWKRESKAPQIRHVLVVVCLLVFPKPILAQVVTGRLVDGSFGRFLGEVRVILTDENLEAIWALTDSAGVFRVTEIPPGEYVFQVPGPCWQLDRRSLLIPEGEDVFDVGTIETSRIPLGNRMTHSNCRPTL